MVWMASLVHIAFLVLFANIALPLQAVTLQSTQDEALLRRRSGHSAAAGEADSRNGMVEVQHLIDRHRASTPELHARAAETFRKFAGKLANAGCTYTGNYLPCPVNYICNYEGYAGFNVSATVEYRGNIIRTIIHPDEEIDQPDLVMFMGATTSDDPAM